MVERTAHDGFDVGSNPARLKMYTSQQKNKNIFQYKKIKTDLCSKNLTLIGLLARQGDTQEWIKLKEKFRFLKVCGSKANNTALKKLISNSVFKNQSTLVSGPMILIVVKEKKLNIKKLFENLKPEVIVLALKINDRIVPYALGSKLQVSGYTENKTSTLRNFSQLPKNLTKLFYIKDTLCSKI